MGRHAAATARICGDETARGTQAPHQGLCSNVVSNFRFGHSEVVLGTGEALLVVVLFEAKAFSGADNFA